MQIKTTFLLAAAICVALCHSAVAEVVIFSEDFEGGTAGAAMNSLNQTEGSWFGNASGNNTLASVGDTSTVFGASNKYMDMSRTTNGFSFLNNTAPGTDIGVNTPVTFAFDLYAEDAAAFPTYLRFVVGMDSGNGANVDIGTGAGSGNDSSQVGTDWNFGEVTILEIVAELTAAGTPGVEDSAVGKFSTFVNGTETATDVAFNFPGGSSTGDGSFISQFSFWHNSTAAGSQVLIDNIQVSLTPVPEPSSLALFGIGCIGLAYRQRR